MEIVYIALLTIVASGLGTLSGFGTSTILVPVLLILYPFPQTLLLVGIIHWFGDIWKLILFREGIRWKLILGFGIPGIIFSFLGARLIVSTSHFPLSQILGVFILTYVVFLFIKSNFKIKQRKSSAIIGGSLSGFFAGLFGIGGAVRGMFLTAFDLPKEVYIATAGAIAFFIDITRLGTYLVNGTRLPTFLFYGLLIFIPASFIGAKIAKRIINKIPQDKFRTVVSIFLLLVGLKLLLFP